MGLNYGTYSNGNWLAWKDGQQAEGFNSIEKIRFQPQNFPAGAYIGLSIGYKSKDYGEIKYTSGYLASENTQIEIPLDPGNSVYGMYFMLINYPNAKIYIQYKNYYGWKAAQENAVESQTSPISGLVISINAP
jgi:hypothetical protein